jgi:CRP-like cAMP-binding protein
MNCISTYNVLQKQRILMTAGLSSSQRLLSWLAKLCNKTQPNTRGWYKIPCTLTQQQIADILFIHVTTCNKLFSRLYKEGIAERTRSHIVIYQFDKMKQYLEEDWKLLY